MRIVVNKHWRVYLDSGRAGSLYLQLYWTYHSLLHMRVAENTNALPVYKKNRIASLLCILETTIPLFVGLLCLSLFCYALLCIHCSFAIILKRKRKLVALLLLSYMFAQYLNPIRSCSMLLLLNWLKWLLL